MKTNKLIVVVIVLVVLSIAMTACTSTGDGVKDLQNIGSQIQVNGPVGSPAGMSDAQSGAIDLAHKMMCAGDPSLDVCKK